MHLVFYSSVLYIVGWSWVGWKVQFLVYLLAYITKLLFAPFFGHTVVFIFNIVTTVFHLAIISFGITLQRTGKVWCESFEGTPDFFGPSECVHVLTIFVPSVLIVCLSYSGEKGQEVIASNAKRNRQEPLYRGKYSWLWNPRDVCILGFFCHFRITLYALYCCR